MKKKKSKEVKKKLWGLLFFPTLASLKSRLKGNEMLGKKGSLVVFCVWIVRPFLRKNEKAT